MGDICDSAALARPVAGRRGGSRALGSWVRSRSEFLALAERSAVPILLVYGAETPARSRAEMDALATLPIVRTELLKRGKLSIHEEFPDDVASVIRRFFHI
jgi:pimeloyl-ACP methyl ester carboxylesterase